MIRYYLLGVGTQIEVLNPFLRRLRQALTDLTDPVHPAHPSHQEHP